MDLKGAILSREIKGIVFDKDGTLFDFNATWGAWARTVFAAETGGDANRLAALAEALDYDLEAQVFRPASIVIASTAWEIAEAVLPHVEETDIERLMARMNAAATVAPQIEAVPLTSFLTGLRNHGLRLGVATNDAEAPALTHLGQAGVTEAFDFIAGSDSGYGGKPAPGQLLAFCEALGLAPDSCLMVGDSTHDLHAGRAAGMGCVAVLTGVATAEDLAPHADLVLPSIADLPQVLGLA